MTAIMKPTSRFWIEWSARDFAAMQQSGDNTRAIAVLPIAAVEQHGPHLPVSVDTTLVEGVIAACLPHLPEQQTILFLPTQAVGKSNEHQRFAGTLTLSAETLMRVWMELGASVARAGIRKLVLFNSHGGQITLMEMVARELRVQHDLLVASTSWFNLPMAPAVHALFTPDEHQFGIHAGDMETSMMLALKPHTVHMTEAQDFSSSLAGQARDYPLLGSGVANVAWQMQDLNPMGAAGNATLASADKGRRVIEGAGEQLARLLAEVDRLPLDTLNQTTGWPVQVPPVSAAA